MRKYLLAVILMAFTSLVFATTINVYEKPDEKSKVITTLQSGDQLMPIFYTEKKDWVKVANPKNGDVGWAKVTELKGPVIITNVNGTVMRQQIIADDKNPQVYSVVQYSGPKELKPEEVQAMTKKMQAEQQAMEASMQQMQKHMQLMMQDMFKDFDRSFYTFPIIQPVIVVPGEAGKKGQEKTKPTK